ncbi:MAG: DNA replication/repair protein RecF [Candidatus Omnitrophota bacterium]
MVISTLKITGFRNLENRTLSFYPKTNLIHGLNGAGKTSILEAIFLSAYGKSFLSRKKSEMINHHADEFIIHLQVHQPPLTNQLTTHYKNRLTLFLDEKKTTLFDLNPYLYPVFFSSADYNLTIESTPYTRKMFDRFLFGADSLYIRFLLGYNNALKQKNYLLKLNRHIPELTSWNKTVSELCKNIVGIKMKFVEHLNSGIKEKFNKNLTIHYRPSLKTDGSLSFFDQFEALKFQELKYRRSLIGPHLDHFDITLNHQPLRLYSSGEKKIHLLMIYIAFIELFRKIKHQYPIFLVDDFDTAMDEKNIDFLIQHYPDMQVIATSVNEHHNFHHVVELKKEK